VDRRAEGAAGLRSGAGEEDAVAAAGDAAYRESLLLEPGFGGRKVGIGDAELRAELVRRQPLMVLRRGGVLLGGEQGLQGGFLLRRTAEDERHAIQGQRRVNGAAVGCGIRCWRMRAGEREAGGAADRRRDARQRRCGRRLGVGCEKQTGGKRKSGQEKKRAEGERFMHEVHFVLTLKFRGNKTAIALAMRQFGRQ
jgi:hypothetical protein